MVKRKQGATLIVTAGLMLSLAFSGLANAAGVKTIKMDGMELFNLRQAAEMYGYSIDWNAKEKSVTLVYMGKMDNMMMDSDMMNKDNMMMNGDMMNKDNMMMNGDMMNQDNMMSNGDMMNKDDMMMNGDMMNKDNMMMNGDMMNKDNMMMESGMKPAGEMIKLWPGSKKMVVDGQELSLDTAPMTSQNSTYVEEMLITKYMMPVKAMN